VESGSYMGYMSYSGGGNSGVFHVGLVFQIFEFNFCLHPLYRDTPVARPTKRKKSLKYFVAADNLGAS